MKTAKNIHQTDNQQDSLKIGDKFDTFYGNGEKHGYLIISKLTDKSVFHYTYNNGGSKFTHEFRLSRNTFNDSINKGLYKKSRKPN